MNHPLRSVFFGLALVLGSFSCLSQSSTHTPHIAFCGYSLDKGFYGTPESRSFITREARSGGSDGIVEVIQRMEQVMSFDVPISVYVSEDENNCYATISGSRRILVADVEFLEAMNRASSTKWAAISIIAHELGHHIAGFNHHADRRDGELDADYWSGYILAKLGASRDATTMCMLALPGNEEESVTHPSKYRRVPAIRAGWDDATSGRIDYSRCQDCEP